MTMTLNEAIQHALDVACEECAKNHRQLADWLTELKTLKEDKHDRTDGYMPILR